VDIERVNADHSGVYTLQVKNDMGQAAASISVRVLAGKAVESEV